MSPWCGRAALGGHRLHFGAVPAPVVLGSHCCLGCGRRGAGVCGSGWGGWGRFVLGFGVQEGERGLAGLFGGERPPARSWELLSLWWMRMGPEDAQGAKSPHGSGV